MRQLLEQAAQRSISYLERLDARPVAPAPQAVDALMQCHQLLPEDSTDAAITLRLLDEMGSPATMASLVAGIESADSWATDFHKWLNVPYDSGLALVRDAEYLPTTSSFRNPADYTPELSRRARGVDVWAVLHALGRKGIVDLIERSCRHARRFAEGLRFAGHRVLNDVVLNQVLVSFGDTQRILRCAH